MISYNTVSKQITVDAASTMIDLYKDSMSTFATAVNMAYPLPLKGNTPTLFTLINGWTITSGSIPYLSSGALKDSAGDNIWTNIVTVGSLATGTTLYIDQGGTVTYTAPSTGHIDILLKVRSSAADISSKVFTVYARKFGNTYDQFTATGGAITNTVPLATKLDDLNLTIPLLTLDSWTDLSITWGSYSKDVGDGLGAQPYSVLIHTTNPSRTLKEIFNWVERQLLKNSDIDTGAGTHIGIVTSELVTFAGSRLFTKQGVFVDGFVITDGNNIQYIDSNGVTHIPPLTIQITVNAPSIESGLVGVWRLTGAYDPITFDPVADIVTALIDPATEGTVTGGVVSKTFTYSADWPVLINARKHGYLDYSLGTTLTNAGLNIQAQNAVDELQA